MCANRCVMNIIPANNVLLPLMIASENWTLVQIIGDFSDTRDVLNWLARQRLMYGTSEHLFETYLVEHMRCTHIHFLPCLYPSQISMRFNVSAQTKTDTKTVIFITTNLMKLCPVAFNHKLKKRPLTHLRINKLITGLSENDKRYT